MLKTDNNGLCISGPSLSSCALTVAAVHSWLSNADRLHIGEELYGRLSAGRVGLLWSRVCVLEHDKIVHLFG